MTYEDVSQDITAHGKIAYVFNLGFHFGDVHSYFVNALLYSMVM